MAPTDPNTAENQPRDSLSSVSTTSIVFDRLQEENEKAAAKRRANHANMATGGSYRDVDLADLDDEDPLKPEDDLETRAFIPREGTDNNNRAKAEPRKFMDKGLRRVLIIGVSIFTIAWLVALGIFVAKGSYHHDSDTEHDPNADHRGSGKAVTLDQVLTGYWRARVHSISWIADPDGKDGLLLEKGVPGKDYLVVEDVRARGSGKESADAYSARVLMKDARFDYDGRSYVTSEAEPSPDLKKVLLGVYKVHHWRHSYTATYFILDVETGKIEPLLPEDVNANIMLATWSPQSDAIAFTKTSDNNLYVRPLDNKKEIVQVTSDGGVECFNGVPDWVYEEEVLSGRSATWWSADGQHIAFFRTNETGVPEYPIQYFVSRPSGTQPPSDEGSFPEEVKIKYPKAGSHNPVVELRFYDVAKNEVFSVDSGDQFPDDDRIINSVVWAGNKKALIKETNRVSDHVKVVLFDADTRQSRTVRSSDVNAIDGGWFEISKQMTYVPADPSKGRPHDGYVDSVIHEGYDHLAYFTPLDSSKPIMLTSGQWEVDDAPSAVDVANNLVYFVSTKESSIQRHVYSVNLLDGSNLQALTDTKEEGYYSASFSHGAGYMLLSYSGPKTPSQSVKSTPSNPSAYYSLLEDNSALAERARKHELPILKYGVLDLGNGVKVNYVERRPPHFNPKKQYPVLFHQYSGPGSQQVNKRFTVDFQSYVASSLGYVVITVDPRGTGFLGRAHRVPVRNQLGVHEAADHIAAAQHFSRQPHVDANRVAIWGWSYGGFQTLKTLEQDAGQTFSYGMAVAPVVDWSLYDSIYTERYMRQPKDNRDGYTASSVTNATALGRNVRFLLMHGVADDNVHFQNSLRLLDALDLAGVENYDVHVFPDSDHSIYFHNANRIVYDKLSNWLINAFNGEWLKIADPKPYGKRKRAVVEQDVPLS
ncbi:hypothetical protein V2G26_005585 [Clonostachys chloroleuca]